MAPPESNGRGSKRFSYGRTVQVAYQEWREGNVSASRALLESTRADLRGWEWRYVHRLCHSDSSHSRGIAGLASFSPDGSRVLTRSQDGSAKVWDSKTGAEILTIKLPTGRVESAEFSPDGRGS